MGALALLLPFASDLLKKLLPDPQAQADAQLKLVQLTASGELAELETFKLISLAQLKVNEADANGASAMQRLWRPLMGWACALALAYSWIGWPLLAWVSSMAGFDAPPKLETDQQLWIIGQMLGLAGMRTVEKLKGVA